MELAVEFVRLMKLHEITPKTVIVANFERLFGDAKTLMVNKDSTRLTTLQEITGSTRYAVDSWMNLSRVKAKIPFEKLCLTCAALHVDIETMLTDRGDWHEVVKEEQVATFEKLRKIQIYRGGWDFDFLVENIKEISGKDEETAMEYAADYLLQVIGLNLDYIKENHYG